MVEIKGWPLPYFANPSYFKTKDDLEAVRNALLTGRCHFAKTSQKRLDELKIKHAKAKEEGRTGEVSILQADLDRQSAADGANTGVARSSTARSSTTISADQGPPQPLQDPPQPPATYQHEFQVDFSMASSFNDVPMDLFPSNYSNVPPSAVYNLPSSSNIAPQVLHQPSTMESMPLQTMGTSVAPVVQGQKRRRWDAGLDHDAVQEVKRLAREADVTPAEYLSSHPDIYERAKEDKQGKAAKKRKARAVRVAAAGSQA